MDTGLKELTPGSRRCSSNSVKNITTSANGGNSHCPTSSWSEYTPTYTYSPPQVPSFYESHQDTAQSGLQLPTVLPEHEYINTSLTSPPMFNSAKANLDPMICASPRYDSSAYYPNNWDPNTNYPTNYYYNTPNNNQQYISANGATMVIYPHHLHSTFNQNQIHLHLHSSPDKLDQYLGQDSHNALTPVRGANELSLSQSGDVNTQPHAQIPEERASQLPDPASVWRPY